MFTVVANISHVLFVVGVVWLITALLYFDPFWAILYGAVGGIYLVKLLTETVAKCPFAVSENEPKHLQNEQEISSSEEDSSSSSSCSSEDDDEEPVWSNEKNARYSNRQKPPVVKISDVAVNRDTYERMKWVSDNDISDTNRGQMNRVDVKKLVGYQPKRKVEGPKMRLVVKMDGDKPVCALQANDVTNCESDDVIKDDICNAPSNDKRKNEIEDVYAQAMARIPVSIRGKLDLETPDDESMESGSRGSGKCRQGALLRDDGQIEETDDGRNVRLKLRRQPNDPSSTQQLMAAN